MVRGTFILEKSQEFALNGGVSFTILTENDGFNAEGVKMFNMCLTLEIKCFADEFLYCLWLTTFLPISWCKRSRHISLRFEENR